MSALCRACMKDIPWDHLKQHSQKCRGFQCKKCCQYFSTEAMIKHGVCTNLLPVNQRKLLKSKSQDSDAGNNEGVRSPRSRSNDPRRTEQEEEVVAPAAPEAQAARNPDAAANVDPENPPVVNVAMGGEAMEVGGGAVPNGGNGGAEQDGGAGGAIWPERAFRDGDFSLSYVSLVMMTIMNCAAIVRDLVVPEEEKISVEIFIAVLNFAMAILTQAFRIAALYVKYENRRYRITRFLHIIFLQSAKMSLFTTLLTMLALPTSSYVAYIHQRSPHADTAAYAPTAITAIVVSLVIDIAKRFNWLPPFIDPLLSLLQWAWDRIVVIASLLYAALGFLHR